jgi:Uma2 family endonuclease
MELLNSTFLGRELYDYEIKRNKPIPDLRHSYVQTNLLFKLAEMYSNNFTILPELNLTMSTGPDAVPDICIYPKMTIDYSNDIESMIEMPLTTIEIISPPQTEEHLIKNAKRYFNAGIQSCWIVLPITKTIIVYSTISQYQSFTSDMILKDLLTGINFDFADIFDF